MSRAPARDTPLVVRDLHKRFGAREVLRGVDLTLARGEFLAILGANGCGKSTLLRCAVRLLDPDDGSVYLLGEDVSQLRGTALRTARREAAVIFQQIALVRRHTTLDNVCAGALGRMSLWQSLHPRLFGAEVRARAVRALDRVGMLEYAWQAAGTLSGGQAQRVAIARAQCQQASVILADEPVSALDPRAADDVLALLAELAHVEALAVLAVLHQPDLALRHCDRVLGMREGAIAFDKVPGDITAAEIAALYEHVG